MIHRLPEDGFPPNLMVQNMLMNKLHKLNISFDKFDESKKLLDDLNRQLREIETLQDDPEYFIDECCRELTRQVDLRRKQLFETIGNYSDLLVQQIDEWKSVLLTRAKENGTRVDEEKLEECKARLGQLNSMIESLEFNNIKMEEIMSQEAFKELAELLKPMAEEYRKNTFKLKTNDIKMEEVFGTLQVEEVFDTLPFKVRFLAK